MGYNSTLVVYNDALDCISKDPNFGKKVKDAIMSLNSPISRQYISSGMHHTAAIAIETHHADHLIVSAIGGNNAINLGYGGHCDDSPEQILKTLAENLGYRLVKKRS